jgi:predicted chitinase
MHKHNCLKMNVFSRRFTDHRYDAVLLRRVQISQVRCEGVRITSPNRDERRADGAEATSF